MTKPSYEELESDVRRWRDSSDANRDEAMKQQDGKLLWKQRHDRLLADYKTSESELLRVRGLLQRATDCEKCDNCDEHFHDLMLLMETLIPSGAESADIGKLDRVDKHTEGE